MDGAVFAQQHASGVGVVIRDHEGLVVAALSKKLWYPLGPLEAEAKAMEEAVEFAWHVGIRDVEYIICFFFYFLKYFGTTNTFFFFGFNGRDQT